MNTLRHCAFAAVVALLAGCAGVPATSGNPSMFSQQRTTDHRDGDDLLTGGLGLAGLRAMVAPAFADAEHPTPAELRRRALWANWRGIADLAPGGGYGDVYGSTASVPGREFTAFARVPGASQPHRVMLQLPDAFDAGKRCIVVAASSGSRGIYGAIAVAGAWGLPKGCAVAYTDKGAGTDYFDLDAGQGVTEDGTVASTDASLAFKPAGAGGSGIAYKHAHSQDNPEADWGKHVKQAAQFALATLDAQLPQQAPFTFANTRVIAVGISNGGGAVLRGAGIARCRVRGHARRPAEGCAGEIACQRLDGCRPARRFDQRRLRPVARSRRRLCLGLRPLSARCASLRLPVFDDESGWRHACSQRCRARCLGRRCQRHPAGCGRGDC